MGHHKNRDAAFDMAVVRKEILTYCHGLPDIARTHGENGFGAIILNLGKCFRWIGYSLDEYTLHQPLPGQRPQARVQDLGEELRVLGLEAVDRPSDGDLGRTVRTLARQIKTIKAMKQLHAREMRAAR